MKKKDLSFSSLVHALDEKHRHTYLPTGVLVDPKVKVLSVDTFSVELVSERDGS